MNNIKLSILVPSTHTRYDNFNIKIQDQLFGQYNKLSEFDQARIEILMLVDNKKQMLGSKRTLMVDMAQGKYIAHVDSDDRISDDYLKTLLDATESDADSITFTAMVSLNGNEPRPCYYSKDFKMDHNTDVAYYRIPNHIPCVKKELSLKSSFPSIAYGEDSAYSKLLLPHLKTELVINKVLYYYDFNSETTETQEHLSPSIRRRKQEPIVDVVFLSNATDMRLYRMTQHAIDTCLAGANSLPVNIIVIEQNTQARYNNATTHYIDAQFNYNQFANIGVRKGSAEWVMICNNDLVFHSGWLHQLLIAGHDLVSPKCPNDYRQRGINENELGVKCGRNFSGWAFMIKRSALIKIGGLDEDFPFWFADNSTIEQCLSIGIEPMLVPKSLVTHLGSTTLNRVSQVERDNLTWAHCDKFNNKYGRNLFHDNPAFNQWKLKQI
jgi:hypothetical protein